MRISELKESTEVLKERTKKVHTETELLLIPQLKNIKSERDYAALLRMFYGFFAPLEKRIESFITEQHLPDIKSRRKAKSLQHDLSFLNSDKDVVQWCSYLPQINNVCLAFGALYVLEGSTLGGVHIAQMLQNNKHISLTQNKLHFFNGYGEDTGAMWEKFKASLNTAVQTDEQLQQAVCSATETFIQLTNWFQNHL